MGQNQERGANGFTIFRKPAADSSVSGEDGSNEDGDRHEGEANPG